MGFVKEFKEFAMRGNVMDMAVGIIIGVAFGKIVNSLVSDVIMPPIGKLMGGADFSDRFYHLGEGPRPESLAVAKEAGVPVIAYGAFINTVLDFLIVALAIFVVIKMMNAAKKRFEREEEAAPPKMPPKEEVLLTEIRDELKRMNR